MAPMCECGHSDSLHHSDNGKYVMCFYGNQGDGKPYKCMCNGYRETVYSQRLRRKAADKKRED